MLNKEGFVISFNWIFSLVAGVLIFSFLIYFAFNNTDLFGKLTSKVVTEELDVLFSGYETSEVSSVLDFGKNVDLRFNCILDNERRGNQFFSVDNGDSKNPWGKVIFAPKNIKTSELNVATASWDVPFRVANFIYLWEEGYNLIHKPASLKLPDNFVNFGDRNIEFIERNNPNCANIASNLGEDGKVIFHDRELKEGLVCFNRNSAGIKIYGEAMILGAIFSEDKNDLECAKSIAVERLKIVNEVYRKKAGKMLFEESCGGVDYNKAVHNVDEIEKFDSVDIDAIESANGRLIRKGCAGVY